MRIRKVESGWWIELDGREFTVTLGELGWDFQPAQLFNSVEGGVEAKIVARLAKELLACRKEARVLRGDLISAYSALADLVHPKDVSMKNEHYEIVKRAHNPF